MYHNVVNSLLARDHDQQHSSYHQTLSASVGAPVPAPGTWSPSHIILHQHEMTRWAFMTLVLTLRQIRRWHGLIALFPVKQST